ncbi:DUF4064 domain-containing protein [Mycoplasma marinum]|uniref:DUF4064 domain-containing protein n=1 Tax=Mycoplasma marinum TaxID=1937190 RepID=A0A4V6N9J9_9MOLU|nr:hypothetical protein C4B24_03700 [Mycoplasma marinum]
MFKKLLLISLVIALIQIITGILMHFNSIEFRDVKSYHTYYWISSGILLLIGALFCLFKTRLRNVGIYFSIIALNVIFLALGCKNWIGIVVIVAWILLFIIFVSRRIIISKRI